MASPFPCFILPFLRFFLRSPSCSFICLFFAFVSPLSRRACPEWLVPFPRLAVLPPFYSLVSLSLCLTVPFIHLFLRLSIICLSNSVWPERLLPFPVSPSVRHFQILPAGPCLCPALFLVPFAVFRPWNDCNALTGQ